MKLTAPAALVLDTTPLGLLTQRPGHAQGDACKAWYAGLAEAGCRFFVPEIADYELRREMLRARNMAAIARLDAFNAAERGRYLPLTTQDVRTAAFLWAQARQTGHVTAPPAALDGDVLIAAQAMRLSVLPSGLTVLVATENARHFAGMAQVELWSDMTT